MAGGAGVKVDWQMLFGGHVPSVARCFKDHRVSKVFSLGQAPAPLWALLSQSVERGQREARETVHLTVQVRCGSQWSVQSF